MYFQLRQEKVELEQTLEQEQECLVNKLMRKIEKLETETAAKQNDLETLRREKVCPLYFCFLPLYILVKNKINFCLYRYIVFIFAFICLCNFTFYFTDTKATKPKELGHHKLPLLSIYLVKSPEYNTRVHQPLHFP